MVWPGLKLNPNRNTAAVAAPTKSQTLSRDQRRSTPSVIAPTTQATSPWASVKVASRAKSILRGSRRECRGRVRSHSRRRARRLEVIDGSAGPLKIFVVLELENEKRQQHADAQPANRGASGGDEQTAQRADEQIPDGPDDREIDGAGGPVTGGKQQAAGERAVLVSQGEEVGEDFRPGGSLSRRSRRRRAVSSSSQ